MSRMLKALQQIEARSEHPRPEYPADDGESSVEVALARVEEAAMMAGSQQPEIPSVEPPPVPWPDLRGAAHVRAYGRLADRVVSRLAPDGGATLVFASPDDADARTEVLIPLAAALVERTPGKVLLVDLTGSDTVTGSDTGAPHRGTLSDRLGLSAARGLPDVLCVTGSDTGTIAWQRAVHRTTVRGLSVIAGAAGSGGRCAAGSGGRCAAPGASDGPRPDPPDVAHLLHEFRGEYRIVLLDAALLHREQLGRIGRHCDGAYLVVRLRQTTRRRLRKAAETIRACHVRLLGSVVVDDRTGPAA